MREAEEEEGGGGGGDRVVFDFQNIKIWKLSLRKLHQYEIRAGGTPL